MKKLFFIIMCYSIFIIGSCIPPKEHCIIKRINVYAQKLENPDAINDWDKIFRTVEDTLKGRLFFWIYGAAEEYQYGYLKNIIPKNNLMASSGELIMDNYILKNSIQLKFDSDISVAGEVITKGTDIWNHPAVKDYTWYRGRPETSYRDLSDQMIIGFLDSFYEIASFPNREYEVEVTCITSDGLVLSKTLSIYIKLND